MLFGDFSTTKRETECFCFLKVITSHDSRGKSPSEASAKAMKDNLRVPLRVPSTLSSVSVAHMLMDGTAFLEVVTTLQ